MSPTPMPSRSLPSAPDSARRVQAAAPSSSGTVSRLGNEQGDDPPHPQRGHQPARPCRARQHRRALQTSAPDTRASKSVAAAAPSSADKSHLGNVRGDGTTPCQRGHHPRPCRSRRRRRALQPPALSTRRQSGGGSAGADIRHESPQWQRAGCGVTTTPPPQRGPLASSHNAADDDAPAPSRRRRPPHEAAKWRQRRRRRPARVATAMYAVTRHLLPNKGQRPCQ
jgi:hypothetical protein